MALAAVSSGRHRTRGRAGGGQGRCDAGAAGANGETGGGQQSL